jgi:hypothetical protein
MSEEIVHHELDSSAEDGVRGFLRKDFLFLSSDHLWAILDDEFQYGVSWKKLKDQIS